MMNQKEVVLPGLFGSAILDTVIGLVFIYLLLAIIVSVMIEFIAQIFALRVTTLEQGLRRLLQGETGKEQQAAKQPGPANGSPAPVPPTAVGGATVAVRDWVTELYDHPLICGMGSISGTFKPSYIPSRQFALALLDLVAPDLSPDAPDYWAQLTSAIDQVEETHLKRTLQTLLRSAHGTVEAFRENIERWFNDSMDRVSGWYKRKVRIIVLLLALGLTAILNADTLNIARILWLNPTLRTGVASVAQDYTSHPPPPNTNANLTSRLNEMTTDLDRVETSGVPLGWPAVPQGADIPREIVGLALTTLAVSLGAPFWFDVLNKFMTFRSTGPPPSSKPGQ